MEDLSKKYDQKTLRLIIKTIDEHFDDINVNLFYNFDGDIADEIDEALKYLGIEDIDWYDYSFYIELVKLNPNYETNKIIVPKLNECVAYVNADVTRHVTERYKHNIFSYFTNPKDVEELINSDENFLGWDGIYLGDEEYDSYTNEIEISHIEFNKKKSFK